MQCQEPSSGYHKHPDIPKIDEGKRKLRKAMTGEREVICDLLACIGRQSTVFPFDSVDIVFVIYRGIVVIVFLRSIIYSLVLFSLTASTFLLQSRQENTYSFGLSMDSNTGVNRYIECHSWPMKV